MLDHIPSYHSWKKEVRWYIQGAYDPSRAKSSASLTSRCARPDRQNEDGCGEERQVGARLLLESIKSSIRFTPHLHPVPFSFASESILCALAADIYHLTQASCCFSRPEGELRMAAQVWLSHSIQEEPTHVLR